MATAAQVQPFVGLQYEAGQFDCADLAALIQRDLFGRCVTLPGHRPAGAMTQAAAIHRHAQELASRIDAAVVADGDAVLLQQSGRIVHIGTFFRVAGVARVLHNSATIGHSVLHRLSDLPAFGLRVEGFYRWK